MSVSRVWEDDEVAPELRRIFGEVRSSFGLPFVPTLFKLLAGVPGYLRPMWNDLGAVARSREFQSAGKAMEEFVRALAVAGAWRFSDQQRLLAGQEFSPGDVEQLGNIAATFARLACRMALFTRLMQKGYSGGQTGRVTNGVEISALARLLTLHVPPESEAGLRVWLIYSDIKRTLGARHVLSMYRVLSPFPAYLAAVWLDSKKMLSEPAFLRARDEVVKRANGLVLGLPVKDHRAAAKNLDPKQWRAIEEAVDSQARLTFLFCLLSAVWHRSFSGAGRIAA
jgi:hypothetical protein